MSLVWSAIASAGVIGLIAVASFMRTRGKPVSEVVVQGTVTSIAGVIATLALFFPWIIYQKAPLMGIGIGDLNVPFQSIFRTFDFFLPIFAMLVIAGGFMQIFGYSVGRSMSSLFACVQLVTSIILILLLVIQLDSSALQIESGAIVFAFASVIALIAERLRRKGPKISV